MRLIKTILLLFISSSAVAQGSLEDYKRAKTVRKDFSNKIYNIPGQINWNEEGTLFWYDKPIKDGREYILVDAVHQTKTVLLTLSELSDALKGELKKDVTLRHLASDKVKIKNLNILEIEAEGNIWEWNRTERSIRKVKEIAVNTNRRGQYWGQKFDDSKGEAITSPDEKYVAFIKNSNLYIAQKDDGKSEKQLTFDGNPEEYYSAHIHWSPDSKKVSTSRVRKAAIRILTLLESSPADQLQPKLQTRDYVKPGDVLPQCYPVIYNIDQQQLYRADQRALENQFSLSRIEWRKDSRAITFEYNRRGHQQFDVIELDASSGNTRSLIHEVNKTFIDYSGKRYRKDVKDGQEIIWASERDGWNHLYLYDGVSGEVKNQITKGNWVVRKVVHVDEESRKIIFEASGKNPKFDPYLIQYYSVDFDGKNLKELTKENANHQGYFNAEFSSFVDIYSRVDEVPTMVLRNSMGKVIMELERGDISDLLSVNWQKPEVFSAKGRDGQTDIWGIIIRPTNFDASKKYPVIEYIYAGPHSSFVPKSFYPNPSGMHELAELGFIVVQIDGMGTSNRSKVFHDVAWKNLKDAGFPDRIAWMKAASKNYPYMDLEKVGIYGTSAGGQSSTGALLFHPEFYKVGVSSCGCHDNRMDKIWWNEQWMGWPIGPHYAECSNTENAGKLEGKLLLIVGEVDDNVDPSSTYQLVDALIKADKDHEFIMVPGMGHSSGGDFGEKKRRDFFVKHLLGVDPPVWDAY
ncbi:S9 family peptidase [Sphingobacterium alkalisoli]|uniref:S9 family peptidase n=1 Tax=Sphingobacterium alkalisoli TaxID=1874115 RepID=A0A4U0GWY8_9SPHI|nr:S9 family peptidase [Sphingobacterium alkalisoli]TJY63516.1 S9 family peptidase [Sphingobacterium alkalisoli]GGH26562.1 peptidase [Sphingobacterium alkalisoli]